MMELVKKENFGEVEVDIYRNESEEMFMTAEQLGEALGYVNPKKGISNIVARNEYLKDSKFSGTLDLRTPGGTQETRVFNEDGIYEIAFKSNTKKAFEFRDWVRGILKSLRKGEKQLVSRDDIEKLLMEQEARIKALMTGRKDETIKKVTKEYEEAPAVPTPREMRETINLLIHDFSKCNKIDASEAYTFIYKKFEEETGISLYKIQNRTAMAPLTFAEKHNLIKELESIALDNLTYIAENGNRYLCDESALYV